MALVKFYKGNETNLPTSRDSNSLYITTDELHGFLGNVKLWMTANDVASLYYNKTTIDTELDKKISVSFLPTALVNLESDLANNKLIFYSKVTNSVIKNKIDLLLAVASNTNNGLMPKEAFSQIEQNTTDISQLKTIGGRFIGISFTTKAALDAYTIPSTVNVNDFTYVEADETQGGATTRYIYDGTKLSFAYIINNPTATNTVLGIVKGTASTNGKIFVETDGTMVLNGYDALASHLTNTTNPHSVTKAQVGLGSVDNTSDVNKPVSTATQTALNLKEDKTNKLSSKTTSPATGTYYDANTVNNITKEMKDEYTPYLVQADYAQTDNTQPNYIKNKPQIPVGGGDNGDTAIMALDRMGDLHYQLRSGDLSQASEGWQDDYAGGYVFNGPVEVYRNQMFNRIKMEVKTPGWARIGIVKGTGEDEPGGATGIFAANPRYSTCLVKWLVVQFVAYNGLHEWDFEDTIITDPTHYLYVECRTGSSGFYCNNSTTPKTAGGITYSAESSNYGGSWPSSYHSTTNGEYYLSNDILSASFRPVYCFDKSAGGGGYKRGWLSVNYNQVARNAKAAYSFGDLNIGVYRRGGGGDYYHLPVLQNVLNKSVIGVSSGGTVTTAPTIWISSEQEQLVGKNVYAFKLVCTTPGNLTVTHGKGRTIDDFKILNRWTIPIRAIGLQTVHLPVDIVLKDDTEWIGFNGYNAQATPTNMVTDTCRFAFNQNTEFCDNLTALGESTRTDIKYPYNTITGKAFKGGWNGFALSTTDPNVATSYNSYHNYSNGYLNICLIVRDEKRSKLEDLWYSVTGDSISTYSGFITKQADVPAGNGAGNNAVFYPNNSRGFVNNVDATYWGILARDCRMRLLRNDAWSGSKVSGADSTTSSTACASVVRCNFLQNKITTIDSTFPYGCPDVITCMIGTNDLSGNIELGSPNYSANGSSETLQTLDKILDSFSIMVARHATIYHLTKRVYFIIPRGSVFNWENAKGVYIRDFVEGATKICEAYGAYFVPLNYFDRFVMGVKVNRNVYFTPTNTNFFVSAVTNTGFNTDDKISDTSDTLHPNVIGMEIIAEGLKRFLETVVF